MRWLAALCCAGLMLAQRAPVEDAWDLLAKGEREGAVRLLRQIVKTNPRDAEARLMLGSILAEDRKHPEAIAHLSEAVKLRPRSADAHNALGEALSGAGDVDGARREFEATIALNPDFAPARVSLGLILAEAGESAAAAEHLDRAIKLLKRGPDAAFAKYLRAKIYTEHEEIEKAAALLADAVAMQPDFFEAWSDLGQARKALLDGDGAFAAFQKAVALNPEDPIARYRLGAEYLRRDSVREAVLHLEEAYRRNPKDQSTLYSLQLALRRNGQLERARLIREQLVEVLREIDRESQAAFTALRLNNEGAALEKEGKLRPALEKYREAVKLDPEHVGIRTNFAVALLRLGYWAEGIAEMREALRRDPRNEILKKALADALAQAPAGIEGARTK
ncbi:MAG: tetratricopeptide repeat protein [Rhodospirillales bacterium]